MKNAVETKKSVYSSKLPVGVFLLVMCAGLFGCGGGGGGGDGGGNAGGGSAGKTSVTGAKVGSASLSWAAPSTKIDATQLSMSEIGGYKIYVGGSESTLVLHADISDPYQMEYVIESLIAGTHYFAVTAYSLSGAESDFSSVVSKTI